MYKQKHEQVTKQQKKQKKQNNQSQNIQEKNTQGQDKQQAETVTPSLETFMYEISDKDAVFNKFKPMVDQIAGSEKIKNIEQFINSIFHLMLDIRACYAKNYKYKININQQLNKLNDIIAKINAFYIILDIKQEASETTDILPTSSKQKDSSKESIQLKKLHEIEICTTINTLAHPSQQYYLMSVIMILYKLKKEDFINMQAQAIVLYLSNLIDKHLNDLRKELSSLKTQTSQNSQILNLNTQTINNQSNFNNQNQVEEKLFIYKIDIVDHISRIFYKREELSILLDCNDRIRDGIIVLICKKLILDDIGDMQTVLTDGQLNNLYCQRQHYAISDKSLEKIVNAFVFINGDYFGKIQANSVNCIESTRVNQAMIHIKKLFDKIVGDSKSNNPIYSMYKYKIANTATRRDVQAINNDIELAHQKRVLVEQRSLIYNAYKRHDQSGTNNLSVIYSYGIGTTTICDEDTHISDLDDLNIQKEGKQVKGLNCNQRYSGNIIQGTSTNYQKITVQQSTDRLGFHIQGNTKHVGSTKTQAERYQSLGNKYESASKSFTLNNTSPQPTTDYVHQQQSQQKLNYEMQPHYWINQEYYRSLISERQFIIACCEYLDKLIDNIQVFRNNLHQNYIPHKNDSYRSRSVSSSYNIANKNSFSLCRTLRIDQNNLMKLYCAYCPSLTDKSLDIIINQLKFYAKRIIHPSYTQIDQSRFKDKDIDKDQIYIYDFNEQIRIAHFVTSAYHLLDIIHGKPENKQNLTYSTYSTDSNSKSSANKFILQDDLDNSSLLDSLDFEQSIKIKINLLYKIEPNSLGGNHALNIQVLDSNNNLVNQTQLSNSSNMSISPQKDFLDQFRSLKCFEYSWVYFEYMQELVVISNKIGFFIFNILFDSDSNNKKDEKTEQNNKNLVMKQIDVFQGHINNATKQFYKEYPSIDKDIEQYVDKNNNKKPILCYINKTLKQYQKICDLFKSYCVQSHKNQI